jgi:adenylate cyclase
LLAVKQARETHTHDDADVLDFIKLMNSHGPRAFFWLVRHLPSDPRCRLCGAPYGGFGGRLMRRVGYGPSRKNPSMCVTCFEKAPMGGAQMEIGVLFVDLRGFTALSESMAPEAVAEMLNGFYGSATEVLSRRAIIDKMVGDQVMALYLPPLLSERWENEMLRDARELLARVGEDLAAELPLQLGVGLDVGEAFVGNVGCGEVKDFTALGDVVNTAARLQSYAQAGQIVITQRLYERLSATPLEARAATLELKGKSEQTRAYVLDVGESARAQPQASTRHTALAP